jgi:large subunit ribosomal protein L29
MTKQVEAMHTLRQMTEADLAEHLRERRRKLFEIRFQQATGQVENHRQIRDLRREIARALTVQIETERRNAAEGSAAVAAPPTRSAAARKPR